MNKLIRNSMAVIALFAILLAQSCSDDDKIQPAPAVSLDITTAQDVPGSVITVTATATAPNGGKLLTAFVGGDEEQAFDMAGATELVQVVDYTIPSDAAIGSIIVVTFQVTDNKDYASSIANLKITVGSPIVELSGTLAANFTISKGTPYLIKGQTFVPSGGVLTVEAGAIVKGDKASKGTLIIQPGGKIMAVGTAGEPIVFTSSQVVGERDRGDWGGIIILGNAYINQSAKPQIEGINPAQLFGTVDAGQANATVGSNTEDSGKLKYVRIEYAGIELTPNNETNSLTLGAVGSTTEIDFVQTSYGGDDGFEWFGGTVNAKHIISLSTWDDDLDTDFGWRGFVQWALVIRNPFFGDQSGSTAFESDSQGNANPIGTVCTSTVGQNGGCTQGVFSNVTVLGPKDYNVGFTSPGFTAARTISGNYTRAMHIRRRSGISIFNSFISGWGASTVPGLTIDDQGTLDNYNNSVGALANNVMFWPDVTAAPAEYGSNVGGAAAGQVTTMWTASSTVTKPTGGAGWSPNPGTPANSIDPYTPIGLSPTLFFGGNVPTTYPAAPNFSVTTGTVLIGQSAATLFPAGFPGTLMPASFFDRTLTYKGAFGATDWTDGWSEFVPAIKVY